MEMPGHECFTAVAFTHRSLPLQSVGRFHVAPEERGDRLGALKDQLGLSELMYLATCNRVEFFMVAQAGGSAPETRDLIAAMGISAAGGEYETLLQGAERHVGTEAMRHLLKVSSSLDSMVVGEREIITQVRNAYDEAAKLGLAGEVLRLASRLAIETAKEIFTKTDIFKKPVSVVSLAFKRLKELNFAPDSRVVMVGAGRTNRAMARFLIKHGFDNLTIYNRTLERAEALAAAVGGTALPLDDLHGHGTGFDVLISCTGAGGEVVTPELFASLAGGETSKKVVIDLALPGDIARAAFEDKSLNVRYIDIEELRETAEKNLRERGKEVSRCEAIVEGRLAEFDSRIRQRQVEMAMRDIPQKIKEIRQTAITAVYAKEVEGLSDEGREVLDKVVSYLEKKYISVPMKMAREVMLNRAK